uniref:Uncharacterized protein n=1 Tax=Vibrio tasmaniensis TaxID=212663 RepID=A0A0H3ZS48_9VIBR|nr:hypothetical protein [Vibrio tasmaniensis]
MSKLEELERLLSDDFSAIEETFNGTYGSELTKLSGLSISDLKKSIQRLMLLNMKS